MLSHVCQVLICLSSWKCPYYSDLIHRISGHGNITVTCIFLASALFLTIFPFVWQSNSLNFLSAVFSWYSTHVNEAVFWMYAWVLKFSELHSVTEKKNHPTPQWTAAEHHLGKQNDPKLFHSKISQMWFFIQTQFRKSWSLHRKDSIRKCKNKTKQKNLNVHPVQLFFRRQRAL